MSGSAYRLAQRLRGGPGGGWTTNTAFQSVSYLFFERELQRLIGEDLEHDRFDLIHRVTPVSPTAASPLASWTDVPMIIGPLNGGLPWPPAFPKLRRREREWLVPLRKIYKLLPYYRSTYQNIRAVISGSRHTATEVPSFFRGRRYFMPENGVDPHRFPLSDGWTEHDDRFRFITVGRIVPYKGLFLTLAAMRDSQVLRDCELIVIGDGPDRARMESLVDEYRLGDQVRLLGWLPQPESARWLSSAQCFVFPSLREFGGGVVLEAMASGLPSIIVDYGGPADLMDASYGIQIPMQPAGQLVPELRAAMESLVGDAARCRQMAENATRRVRDEFSWPTKAARLVQIYHEVLEVKKNPCPTADNLELVTSA